MSAESGRRPITKEEVWALVDPERWTAIRELIEAEARVLSPDARLRQLSGLIDSGPMFARFHIERALGTRSAAEWADLHRVAESPPGLLLPALRAVAAWLAASAIDAIFVGGVAVTILGRARYTEDVDVLAALEDAQLDEALACAAEFGLKPRVADAARIARERRVLLLMHGAACFPVDVILARVPLERETIRRGHVRDVEGIAMKLPQLDDLILMKALAHRLADLGDIDTLLAMNPDVDVTRALAIVRDAAQSIGMSDVIEDLERIVRRRRESR